jgi:hypothetical protein
MLRHVVLLLMATPPAMQVFDNVCWCLFIFEFFTGGWQDNALDASLVMVRSVTCACIA